MHYFTMHPCEPPWGDYGRVLLHGLSRQLPRNNGMLQLQRVGSFVPPMTFPAQDVLVTEETKHLLETLGIEGLRFRSVIKARIVKLEWRIWDLGAGEPREYPPETEPANYVLYRDHDAGLADKTPNMWELDVDWCGEGSYQRLSGVPRRFHTSLKQNALPRPEMSRAEGVPFIVVGERLRNHIESWAGEWTQFFPAELESS